MRNTVFAVTALFFFGACSSEPTDEVGRYVPIGKGLNILDTKTGVVYDLQHYEYGIFRRVDFLHPEIREVATKGIIHLEGKTYEQGNSNK